MTSSKPDRQKAAEIVRDAGGKIIGRTRLQKVTYLLELAGLGEGFYFEYRHYGPYSEDLARAIDSAIAFELVNEEELPAVWGGLYSIYTATERAGSRPVNLRCEFAEKAASVGSIELELAATAAYIAVKKRRENPWEETALQKPEKTGDGRLERAREAYRALRAMPTPTALPALE